MRKVFSPFVFLFLYACAASAAGPARLPNAQHDPPFLKELGQHWVDSVFRSLSPDQRLAQLFMVAAYSNKDQQHVDAIANLVQNYNIGGLIFFQGGPVRQAQLCNYYQSLAKTPLLISIDAENGLAMRLDSTMRFPKQMTLGAIADNTKVYSMGAEIARECKRMGIQVNFAPVIDVNNNPDNPVINNRSFGQSKQNVSDKGIAYMKGMQDHGVMANAKHFPGHGDTDADSHKALPTIRHSRMEMDTLDLYPFRALIEEGLGSMMVAHLFIPSMDSTKNVASTLSHSIVTDCLQNEMCFQGLIFTDALNMKGVSSFYEPGIVDVKALLAGNDVLLFSEDVPRAMKEIKRAMVRHEITQEEIDRRVKKIITVKFWTGLNKYEPIETENLVEELNTPEAYDLNYKLFESSVTLLKNNKDLIPLRRLDTLRIASIALNDTVPNTFQEMLSNYAPVDQYQLAREVSAVKLDSTIKKLSTYNLVIASIHGTNTNPEKNFGISAQTLAAVTALQQRTKVVLAVFGNPYCLGRLIGCENSEAVLVGYEDLPLAQSVTAQAIFGGITTKGKLPVTASSAFPLNTGIETKEKIRLAYTPPEEAGIHARDLAKLDSMALRAIQQEATPGCEVLVIVDGKVIYQRSFGHHTYPRSYTMSEKPVPVRNTDIYDLASVTKMAATALVTMKMYDEGNLDLDKKLSRYLPDLKNSNKSDVGLRQMLVHQAGMQPWIPFWKSTVKDNRLLKAYYRTAPEAGFTVRVAENLYERNDYPDSVWAAIVASPVKEKPAYVYSDLDLMIMKQIVESENKNSLDTLVRSGFYAPLGLATMGFNPRNRFELSRLIPTEDDQKFRHQLVHGDVHDPAAAMLGGVSGHAGLFSNANDLGIVMQMLLQQGEYGGVRYFKPTTVEEFTKQQFSETDNRRGLIFDKPETDFSKNGPTARSASPKTFGHTGFTGTCAWADPENNVVFVFLSNRINPDAGNTRLTDLGIRTNMQQVVYDAMRKGKVK